MNYWIFQGNPDQFDIDGYLRAESSVTWEVRQEHYGDDIRAGDEVYFWQSSGSDRAVAGVVAVATVTEPPTVRADDDAARPYWRVGDPAQPALRVRLRVDRRCLGPKEVVKKDWIKEDPILSGLTILSFAARTNYPIRPNEAQRLDALCRNTGRVWSPEECLAGLWAYKETRDGPVSKLPGSPVAHVAVLIGRAVTGVYNKVMNFRSIDPTDERTGMRGTNDEDHRVWERFFDPSTRRLDGLRIDDEFRRLWGGPRDAATPARPQYAGFGQAPDDDPADLRQFARRVRKGQGQFREHLLRLYDGRCAVSGWAPAAVLQAAHVWDHAECGINHTDNGILLRSDLHDLFDDDLLRIDPDTCLIRLDESLRATEYWALNGVPLRPRQDGSQPCAEYLRRRWTPSAAAPTSSAR